MQSNGIKEWRGLRHILMYSFPSCCREGGTAFFFQSTLKLLNCMKEITDAVRTKVL